MGVSFKTLRDILNKLDENELLEQVRFIIPDKNGNIEYCELINVEMIKSNRIFLNFSEIKAFHS